MRKQVMHLEGKVKYGCKKGYTCWLDLVKNSNPPEPKQIWSIGILTTHWDKSDFKLRDPNPMQSSKQVVYKLQDNRWF